MKIIYSEILDNILQKVLKKYFPELLNRNIEICFTFVENDYGAAKSGNKIILLLPDIEIDFDSPGIAHELCHFMNLKNPNKEFKARMPEKFYKLWQKLEKMGEVKCDGGKGGSFSQVWGFRKNT